MLKRDNSCQQQGSFTTSSTKNNSDDLSDEEKCITPSSSSRSSESQIIEECEESEENVESESFDESKSVIGVQRSSSTLTSSSAVTFSSLPPSTTLLTIPSTMRQQSSSSEILYDDQNILHQNDLIFRLPPPHVNNNSGTTIQQRQSSSSYSEQPSMLYPQQSSNLSSFSMQRHNHYSNNNTNQRRVKSKTTTSKKNPDSLYKYLTIILLIYFYAWAYMVYYHSPHLIPSKNNADMKNTNQKSLTLLKEQSIKYSDQLSNNLIIPKEIHRDNEPPTDNHKHIIPNILTFTHSINLLPSQQNTAQNLTDFYQSLPTPEDAALAQNIQNILKLHSNTTQVNFLTDSDCIEAIQKAFSSSSSSPSDQEKSNSLVKYFLAEKQGMYKADICRGAALYNTGGLYMDVDIQPLLNIWTVLQEDTEFVTIKVHKDSHHPDGFFQAFIGVTPQNEIMKRYLEYFLQYYQDKIFERSAGSMAERVGDHPLGVVLLSYALHDVLEEEEKAEKGNEDSSHSIELWQEVLYHPKLFPDIEMPKRGMRRACYMYVGIPWMKGVAPFKSRVTGSRMCGGKDSVQKKNKL